MADKYIGQVTAAASADNDQILFNDVSDTSVDATGTAKIEAKSDFLAGKADLVSGKVPSSQIPAVALTSVQTAASQSAQLALTTQEGDVVVRTDQSKTYVRNAGTAGDMTDFTLLNTPTDLVTSVNGHVGDVVLGNTDVGAAATSHSHAESDVTGLTSDLAAKVPTTRTVNSHPLSADVTVTKSDVGLGSTDDTADVDKPVSTAQQAAIDALDRIHLNTTRAIMKNTDPDYGSGMVIEDTGDYLTAQALIFPAGFYIYGNAGEAGAGMWDKAIEFLGDDMNIVTPAGGTLLLNGAAIGGGGGGSSTPRTTVSYTYDSLSRYYTSGYSGGTTTTTSYGAYLEKGSSSTTGGAQVMEQSSPTSYHIYDKNPQLTTSSSAEVVSSGNPWSFYTVMGNIGSASSVTPTSMHFGFIVRNNAGSHEIIATNADGTTQTTTVNTDYNITNSNHLTAIMTSGTDIKFYVNGTLIATHTTHLPSGYVNGLVSNILKGDGGTGANATVTVNSNTVSYDVIN